DVPRALERCAPALVMLRDQALLVVARRGSRLRVLSPDLKISSLSLAALAAAMREPAEAEAGPQIEALLDRARLQGRRREQTRTALLGARVGGARVSGWWIFRARPGADPLWQAHSAGLQRGLVAVAALYAAQFAFWLLTWWLIGVAALQGRLEWGWLLAWGLLRLTIIPLRVAVSWASGSLAIDAGALLKVRLLAGALRLLPEETRSEGVGRLLGRTLESEAVEQLGTGGAFLALFGGIELVFSAVVLALGAAGPLHAVLLAG